MIDMSLMTLIDQVLYTCCLIKKKLLSFFASIVDN